ncbi:MULTISPECIES: hypothetical protein [unclassified Leeuwenhoekiella]|nr:MULTISPECIES: hypothetical protein [unclassified Leeuwenhoekiella]MAW93628.1 hypothetical protein [Leeuwenhoekiella sp.]MBA80371.1 hypothetical protein [Leeuwenhoekiella sp.]|tara:strand:+ start:60739 stop:62367 length:1629 start_codon:yes stop_codon:yes gene_type:complete
MRRSFSVFCISFLIFSSSPFYAQQKSHEAAHTVQQSSGKKSTAVSFSSGIALPSGDFKNYADDGVFANIGYTTSFCEGWFAKADFQYIGYSASEDFSTRDIEKIEPFQAYGLSAGLLYAIKGKVMSIDLYVQPGISFFEAPKLQKYYESGNFLIENTPAQSQRLFNAGAGLNLNVKFCDAGALFVNAEYRSYLTGSIISQTRNIENALTADGTIDPDLLSTIPFEQNDFRPDALQLGIGVRWNLNTTKNLAQNFSAERESNNDSPGTRATDHNSSRSNKTSSIIIIQDGEDIILRKRPGRMAGETEDSSGDGSRATDYNSSRSNKNTSGSAFSDYDDGGNNPKDSTATRATDHNSSRSNKTSSIIIIQDGEDIILRKRPGRMAGETEDSSGDGSRATDYNSNRSNKNTSGSAFGDDDGSNNPNDSNVTRATDHNSSRSNKTSSIIIIQDGDGDTDSDDSTVSRATDHNSSRSNKTSSIIIVQDGEDIILRKRPGRMAGETEDSSGDGSRATDYNSSRSNTTSAIIIYIGDGDDIILRKRPGR